MPLTYNMFTEYLNNTITNINKKAEILTYDFNIKILLAPYSKITDTEYVK